MLRCQSFRSLLNTHRYIRLNSISLQPASIELVPSAPSNKHLFVDATTGDTAVDIKFIEEPLGLSAEQGYGFPRFEFGESLGPDNRFKVVRKLDFGVNSST